MHLLPQTQLQNGKYRIIEKIGQGGFGIIYKAYHRDLDCEVCIKEFFYRDLCERKSDSTHITVVSTSAEKIEMVKSLNKKFFKEAQRLGQFRSANIIQVMDCFEENSTAYFVMEYINGGSLEQYLETNGKLSEPKAKEIITPIIKALGLVHDKGLLHLDIKPANIMIRKDESPVLIDFGISKYFDVDGGHTTTAPIGISKGFAPIEQYGGNVADFSKATDIYSLCATLYRMVTGTNPPEPLMVMQKGIESPQKLNASLSIAFSELIVKGLLVNKGDRPQKVDELLESMGDISKPTIPKPKIEEPMPSIEKIEETTELLEKPKEEEMIEISFEKNESFKNKIHKLFTKMLYGKYNRVLWFIVGLTLLFQGWQYTTVFFELFNLYFSFTDIIFFHPLTYLFFVVFFILVAIISIIVVVSHYKFRKDIATEKGIKENKFLWRYIGLFSIIQVLSLACYRLYLFEFSEFFQPEIILSHTNNYFIQAFDKWNFWFSIESDFFHLFIILVLNLAGIFSVLKSFGFIRKK